MGGIDPWRANGLAQAAAELDLNQEADVVAQRRVALNYHPKAAGRTSG